MDQIQQLDKESHLVDLLISVIQFWLSNDTLRSELFIAQSLIEMLDGLIYSKRFWLKFKESAGL